MKHTLPVSIIKKRDVDLLYFDADQISNPDKIEAAHIIINEDNKRVNDGLLSVSLNEHLTKEERDLLDTNIQFPWEQDGDYCELADVSEAVKMIASGYIENKGILIKNAKRLSNVRLQIYYRQDVIYPRSRCIFFEKELALSGFRNQVESPWFYSGNAETITFFIINTGLDPVQIHLENSPNAIVHIDDAQRTCVQPNQTVDIMPYKFSKFIRLVASSHQRKVNCRIWFQSQLLKTNC